MIDSHKTPVYRTLASSNSQKYMACIGQEFKSEGFFRLREREYNEIT